MKKLRRLTERRNKSSAYDTKDDAQLLNGAMKGAETDDNILVNFFTTRNRRHIQEVKEKYEDMYHNSLESVIKTNTTGHFQDVLLNLCMERNTLKCHYLRKATEHEHKDVDMVIYILLTCNDEDLKPLNESCKKHYGCELGSLLEGFPSDFQHLMKEYLKVERPESDSKLDEKKVDEDVNILLSGDKKATEGVLVEMFAHRSRRHLRNVAERYEKASGQPLKRLLRRDTSNSREFRKASKALVVRKSEYHACLYFKALKGANCNNEVLIRLCTTLSKRRMMKANFQYTKRHDAALQSVIKSKTSGPYSRTLTGLIPPSVAVPAF